MFEDGKQITCSYCGNVHPLVAGKPNGHQAIKDGWQYKKIAKDFSILVICVNCKKDNGRWTKYWNTEGAR